MMEYDMVVFGRYACRVRHYTTIAGQRFFCYDDWTCGESRLSGCLLFPVAQEGL